MKRSVLMIFLCMLLHFTLRAQNPSGLIGFEVKAPVSAVQGNRVRVEYVLKASEIHVREYPQASGGCLVNAVQKTDRVDGRYWQSTFSLIYEVTCNGCMTIKPMEAVVGGVKVYSDQVSIEVAPSPSYGQEWQIARNYLHVLCGYSGNDLRYKYSSETLAAFSDDKAEVFAIVVSEDYQRYMKDPILAYGEGNPMWQAKRGDTSSSIYAIMKRYDRQLKYLKSNNEVYHTLVPTSYEPSPDGAGPLLGAIEYGQSLPYNSRFPQLNISGRDTLCIAGCGPVALAQVLSLHKSPFVPQGHGVFNLRTKGKYRADLEDYPFSWSLLSPDDLSAMMFCSAVSVGADMSPVATSSSLSHFKSALVCNWNYSPRCKHVSDHYDFSMLALIYKEIDEGRPVIVADEGHIFVCDGYYRDFLHYNLGWNGYCNGYYRAIVIPSADERQLPFSSMLIGVEPMNSSDFSEKTVCLSAPGTLASKLTDAEKRGLTSLVVKGPVNGDDIRLIRQMAGAIYLNYYSEWIGSLMSLDLSGADIVGGDEYCVDSADGYKVSGNVYKDGVNISYSYDFSEMTDSSWRELCSLGVDTMSDTHKYCKGADGGYYVIYIAEDDVIGEFMFAECHNLRQIALPGSAARVAEHAFRNCTSLQYVYLNGAASDVSENAFHGADRLEEVR